MNDINIFLEMVKEDIKKNSIELDKVQEIWKIGLSEYLIFKKPESFQKQLERFHARGNSIQSERINFL